MAKLFGWIPTTVRTSSGVIVVGLLVGYVLSLTVSTISSDQGWFAASGESGQARAYMVALLQRESESLSALRPQQDVVSQALAEQSAQQSRAQTKPLSLTYLGGVSQGNFSVQLYAVEVRGSDGAQQLFPLALTLLGGKVVATR